MKNTIILLCVVLVLGCRQNNYKNPHVIIDTQFGDIEIELFPDKAPKTVAAFLSYVDSGFYDKASFYRVLKTEDYATPANTGLIQGGIWQSNPAKKETLSGIPHESTKQSGLTHQSGAVSLARTTPGSASSEFFICIGDQSPLDAERRGTEDGQGFAAFGQVFDGMDIVRKIQARESSGDKFVKPVIINKIRRL